MQKNLEAFFNRYTFGVLAGLAIAFFVIIVSLFAWGIGDIVMQAGRAVSAKPIGGVSAGFDLNAAAQLNYHGANPGGLATPVPSAATNTAAVAPQATTISTSTSR